MFAHHRYQFPIAFHFYKWGLTAWIQKPIVRKYICPPVSVDDDGSISIFLNIFDE
jgi:hypothetical protein